MLAIVFGCTDDIFFFNPTNALDMKSIWQAVCVLCVLRNDNVTLSYAVQHAAFASGCAAGGRLARYVFFPK